MGLQVSEGAIAAAQQALPKPVVDSKLGEGLRRTISNQIIQMMGVNLRERVIWMLFAELRRGLAHSVSLLFKA